MAVLIPLAGFSPSFCKEFPTKVIQHIVHVVNRVLGATGPMEKSFLD